ncbi:MAG: hypothetical protein OXF54_17445 [Caldilineaceae bacterium]|nr:hypothetical protein [Caldilineaceae bacterium]
MTEWRGTILECSELLLRVHGDKLLLVESDGGSVRLLWMQETGVWREDTPGLGQTGRYAVDAAIAQLRNALFLVPDGDGRRQAALARQFSSRCNEKSRREIIRGVSVVLPALRDLDPDFVGRFTICRESALDPPGRYIGAANGVIDLDTGALLTGQKAAKCLVTKAAPTRYLPDEEGAVLANKAKAALPTELDEETKDYLVLEIAYSLRGHPSRRVVIIVGPPRGGKTSIFSLLRHVLGPYAMGVSQDALQGRGGKGGLAPELVQLMTARIGVMDEAESLQLSRGRLKALSGDSVISYRDLYQSQRDGVPTATLFMPLNQAPRFGMDDAGVFDRIRVLEFPVLQKPQERWVDLQAENAEGWLRLVVDSARNQTPPEMPAASMNLRDAMRDEELSEVGIWLRDCLKEDPSGFVTTEQIWRAACNIVGVDSETARVAGGFSKSRLTRAVREQFRLPAAKQQRINGTSCRGFRGWALEGVAK